MEVQKGNIENGTQVLKGLLQTELTTEQRAEIYFRLYEIYDSQETFKVKAIEIYTKLVEKTPRYLYKDRLNQLIQIVDNS